MHNQTWLKFYVLHCFIIYQSTPRQTLFCYCPVLRKLKYKGLLSCNQVSLLLKYLLFFNQLTFQTTSTPQADYLDKDICLLVDEKDKFIGTAAKRDCHKVGPDGNLLLHRAFSVFLFNKRGDMLLQRRSSQKVSIKNISCILLCFKFWAWL